MVRSKRNSEPRGGQMHKSKKHSSSDFTWLNTGENDNCYHPSQPDFSRFFRPSSKPYVYFLVDLLEAYVWRIPNFLFTTKLVLLLYTLCNDRNKCIPNIEVGPRCRGSFLLKAPELSFRKINLDSHFRLLLTVDPKSQHITYLSFSFQALINKSDGCDRSDDGDPWYSPPSLAVFRDWIGARKQFRKG